MSGFFGKNFEIYGWRALCKNRVLGVIYFCLVEPCRYWSKLPYSSDQTNTTLLAVKVLLLCSLPKLLFQFCRWKVEDPSQILAHSRAGPVFISLAYPSAQPPLSWVLPFSFPHSIVWHNVSLDPFLVVSSGQWSPLDYLHCASQGKNLFLPLPISSLSLRDATVW